MAICIKRIPDGSICGVFVKGGGNAHANGGCRTPRQTSRRSRKESVVRFRDPLKIERGVEVKGTGVPRGE
jgi:hypothetical protein